LKRIRRNEAERFIRSGLEKLLPPWRPWFFLCVLGLIAFVP
jgi:hypothetical protein